MTVVTVMLHLMLFMTCFLVAGSESLFVMIGSELGDASTVRSQVCQVLVGQFGLMVVTVMFTLRVGHIMFSSVRQRATVVEWPPTCSVSWYDVFFVNLTWFPGDVVCQQIPNLVLLTNREAPGSVDLLLDQRVLSQNGSRCARWHGD